MRSILLLALAAVPLGAAGMRAGVARVDITPRGPIWMSGYASRNHPSEGVRQNLWARALVIEAAPGGRVAIVTTDLVGLARIPAAPSGTAARANRRMLLIVPPLYDLTIAGYTLRTAAMASSVSRSVYLGFIITPAKRLRMSMVRAQHSRP